MQTKYIFITGGVVSGLGKGITAASLGRLLKNRGYKVANQKLDPYINVNPGIMSPYEHGEIFVTNDGTESDLDLGHYERFTDENVTKYSSITTGKIYLGVIEKEKRGEYLGKTIQVIPHITDAIKKKIYEFENIGVDIVITEIGGTVGDIEGLPFLEAIRQIGLEKDVIYIHVTLLPYIYGSNEVKSKPTQHSVRELQSIGIKPNILVCRAEKEIDDNMKNKLALFCNVKKENVIQNHTTENIYEIPLMLEKEGLANRVCEMLNLKNQPYNENWEKMINRVKHLKNRNIKIAIIGKYIELKDSYLSIIESIKHGGFANNCKVDISFMNCETITENNVRKKLQKYNAILISDDLESNVINGKITAIKYARENKIPFLGIGLGVEIIILEFIKNVLRYSKSNINLDVRTTFITNNNMKLGEYKCRILPNTLTHKIYNTDEILERHRNYYKYKNIYKQEMKKQGLICSGISLDDNSVEIVELKNHPFFIGSQFHPEFKSRPDRPHPLFIHFIKAAEQNVKIRQRD